jgi:enolase
MTATITSVTAQQLLDCKTRPMVEVEIRTSTGHRGRGAAPTGQSVGVHESVVLRDGDAGHYDGLGVHGAVANVTDVIAPALVGLPIDDQAAIDRVMLELDGTADKSRLGGNAIYSTSIAALRAAAAVADRPVYRHVAPGALSTVPVPGFNMVNGGRYGDLVQAFNEFIVLPHGAATIDEAVEIGVAVFERLGRVIEQHTGRPAGVAKSYGYVAPSNDPGEVLRVMQGAVDDLGLTDKVAFALDAASSEMYDRASGSYELAGARVSAEELIQYTRALSEEFDLLFVEDLLDEDDWAGFSRAVEVLERTVVLGDDLIVTNRDRLTRAIDERAVDGFILKPNQVGTITESLETYELAARSGLVVTPSGRSGGVIDDVVMDLSVGLQVPFQKNGAPRSGERIEKLNFLMRAARDFDGELADISAIARF